MVTRKTLREPPGRNGFQYRRQYGLIVICAHERDQARTYSRLRRLGYTCKVVTV